MQIDNIVLSMLGQGLWESLYMVILSSAFSYILGIPLGVILVITDKNGIHPNRPVNFILGVVINILRSIPFLILLITVIPITRAIVHTSIGPNAVIVPLVFSAAPYVARMVESSLKEVDSGVVEAAKAMGASTMQIVIKVLLAESVPSLLIGAAISITTILGYSAMAGFVGGGGLGTIAINYGYYRYQTGIMLVTVAILVIIVQIIQAIGMNLARRHDRRIR